MPAKTPSRAPARSSAWRQMVAEYWSQSRRPLSSLAFVLPLLAIYEGGVLVLGSQAVRNGADVWLRQFLDQMGFGQYFLLPAMTVGLLLAWHHITRDSWRVSAGVLYAMLGECLGLGALLVVVARAHGTLLDSMLNAVGAPRGTPLELSWVENYRAAAVARMLGFAGAGVYEEVLFRLLLLPPLAALALKLGARGGLSTGLAVLLTSLVFSFAHYAGPHGEVFHAYTFWFRFLAGVIFAVLFVYRGFGIAAGTHALYDVFVSIN